MMAEQDGEESHAWAKHTFGHAALGDERRVHRLVTMAAAVASRPAGTVTKVFTRSAKREGAFRWLENMQVDAAAVAHAAHVATARKSAGEPWVYVALDGSSLSLTDRTGHRGLGRVGKQAHTRGLQVMNALAVDAHGVPLGLVDQRWWAREQPPRFQLDRGGNCWAVLQTAIERSLLLTAAMGHNRRLVTSDERTAYLRDHLQHQRPLGTYDLSVPARPGRAARIAHMTVRTASVTLDLRVARTRHVHVTLQACLVCEEGGPKGDQLEWFLLTTHPLATFDQARAMPPSRSPPRPSPPRRTRRSPAPRAPPRSPSRSSAPRGRLLPPRRPSLRALRPSAQAQGRARTPPFLAAARPFP
jgi:Transposase DNA-binding